MSVLSIDVGLKNLAVCIVAGDRTIQYWNVLTVSGVSDMIQTLDNECVGFIEQVRSVVIEKQPSFNPKMRSVSSALEAYFIIRGQIDTCFVKNIVYWSPKFKLQLCDDYSSLKDVPASKRYRMNKKMAIAQTHKMMIEGGDKEKLLFFEKHKKKDDLADSYLQAISFMSHKNITPPALGCAARKPTPKQLKSKKLSRANVKYLCNCARSDHKKDIAPGPLELFVKPTIAPSLEEFVENYFKLKHPSVLAEYDVPAILGL